MTRLWQNWTHVKPQHYTLNICMLDSSIHTSWSYICQIIKVKVNLSLSLTKYHAIRRYRIIKQHTITTDWWSGGIAPRILNLVTRWRQVVSFTHFTPSERTPGTHWIGGWVGPRAGLDAVAKREKFLAPAGNRILIAPIVQPVAWSLYRLSYPRSLITDVCTSKYSERMECIWMLQ
jgi:hypothetical protein